MYTNYFGLQELPFSIAPNPDFMFMSDRHREALTHLTYGLGDTGGFVLLTGEVGTGKTTVSRCVLQQLPENTQVAFILNPTLSAQELLATICDELKIRYRKTGATLKTLTDKIQEKLLKNHQSGLNTVLIIDEAQHLQPEVLEQLRLLTNLETNTKKLLQVILIGQPELQQLLQRQDLRQLAQRITARYHLMPLTKQEVVQYIKHRLDVAKSPRMLFNDSAISLIHKLSNGIPRLINLLCDRSLLRAYSSNQTLVNKKTVLSASYEALGQEKQAPKWSQQALFKVTFVVAITVAVLVSAALFTGFWFANQQNTHNVAAPPPLVVAPEPEQVVNATTAQKITPEPVIKPEVYIEPEANYASKQILGDEQVTTEQKAPVEEVADIQKNKEKQLVEPELLAVDGNPRKVPDFKVEQTDGVSDELLSLFQTAIEETKALDAAETSYKPPQSDKTPWQVKTLTDMPAWVQNGVPKLNFEMHLYESDGFGSVKVNGQEKFVGDMISDDLELIAVERQLVILQYKGEQFSLPSLSSWE